MTWAAAAATAIVAAVASPMTAAAPPPAFARTAAGVVKLDRGSYCWPRADGAHVCADYARIGGAEPKLPRVVARRGELVRFRLWFQPTELHVRVGPTRYRPRLASRFRVRARRSGEVHVFARARRGDVSYYAQLVVREP